MIAIVDYGMGNIHSVVKAIQLAGSQVCVTDKPEDVLAADKVVLPGVGAFCDAMQGLKNRNLVQVIIRSIKNGKYFLGICLGMQLLFQQSDESQDAQGMAILHGEVKKFNVEGFFKVPHIGWNQLNFGNCKLLRDIPNNTNVYFCHSYYVEPKDKGIIAATTDYGIKFSSVVNKDNIFGVQFHPEKSQNIGLKILKNFVEL